MNHVFRRLFLNYRLKETFYVFVASYVYTLAQRSNHFNVFRDHYSSSVLDRLVYEAKVVPLKVLHTSTACSG